VLILEKTLKVKQPSATKVLVILLITVSLMAGGLIGYIISFVPHTEENLSLQNELHFLENQVSEEQIKLSLLENQVNALQTNSTTTYLKITSNINEIRTQSLELQEKIFELQSKSDNTQNITVIMERIVNLQNQLSEVTNQLSIIQNTSNITNLTNQYITYLTGENTSLSQLFEQVKSSVVVIQGYLRQTDFFGRVYYSQIQGSGFVYNTVSRMVVLTNNHVVAGALNITVTFTTGETYSAAILGSSANADFAVLTTNAPQNTFVPLTVVSSSTLKVGDPVIVVGTPYGLAGSMSNGIVSALNRTLSADQITIPNVIQTTAPLNPGNSGGPVMNYKGQVVGIATAIVQESQGIGFAIPSDTFLIEIRRIVPT
jgi:S1-C subfamily serine protease/cell division protein FtsL